MIDLYKAYLVDIESIGARYSTANTFYMTVVSALLGVLAFADGSKPLAEVRVELVVVIAVLAIVICWISRAIATRSAELASVAYPALNSEWLRMNRR